MGWDRVLPPVRELIGTYRDLPVVLCMVDRFVLMQPHTQLKIFWIVSTTFKPSSSLVFGFPREQSERRRIVVCSSSNKR
jgi:hypothetical protein